jgi:hypothetical protein
MPFFDHFLTQVKGPFGRQKQIVSMDNHVRMGSFGSASCFDINRAVNDGDRSKDSSSSSVFGDVRCFTETLDHSNYIPIVVRR